MTQPDSPFGLRNIGEEAKPPFVVLPDPSTLFLGRSKRLRALAPGHVLETYLNFAADVTLAQHETQAGSPPPLPAASSVQLAREHGTPPLSRTAFEPGDAEEKTLTGLLDRLCERRVPDEAGAAISALRTASADKRRSLMRDALMNAPADSIAERVFVLAGLQVVFAGLAGSLDEAELHPVADGVCPACGSPPMTSSVVGWPKAHNSRFCACSLCGAMWNVVRVKCVLCSSTEGVAYHVIEGQPETVKAETCDKCGRYVKILYQVKDHLLDPLADDVASLGLDALLVEDGWKRGGVNLFLLGY